MLTDEGHYTSSKSPDKFTGPALPRWPFDIMTPLNSVWLTAHEAASYLKVDHRTLLAWARQGKVKGFTLSGTKRHVWRFRQLDLDAMLELPAVLNTAEGE